MSLVTIDDNIEELMLAKEANAHLLGLDSLSISDKLEIFIREKIIHIIKNVRVSGSDLQEVFSEIKFSGVYKLDLNITPDPETPSRYILNAHFIAPTYSTRSPFFEGQFNFKFDY